MTAIKPRPGLLDERMKSLGLNPASLERTDPAVMRDLQRACESCSLKSRCAHDLASEQRRDAVAAYCPNEQALKALRQT